MRSFVRRLPRLRLAVVPAFLVCALGLVLLEPLAELPECHGVTATIGVRN
jgi:hypothetical protein